MQINPNRSRLIGIVLPVICSTALFGQAVLQNTTTTVPRLVRVGSSFHPADGSAAAPIESVMFSIYTQETGGSPLWQEVQNVRVDREGRYNILLGSTTNDGLPQDLFASSEPRWLGVQFQRAGEVEQPRVRLASVPYALKAADADTLGGHPASAYLLNPSADTSSTATPASTTATGAAASKPAPRFSSLGTTGSLALFTDNAGDIGNSVMFQNSGKIGLGTASPSDILHIGFTDNSGALTGLAVQNFGSTASSFSGMLFYDQNGSLGQFQGFNNATHEYRINNIASNGSINFMLGGNSKFRVTSTGDIEMPVSILKNGAYFIHNLGTQNTAIGLNALNPSFTGINNTAVGVNAIENISSGNANTAIGVSALQGDTSGASNTASGYHALYANTDGNNNTAVGNLALSSNNHSSFNTAVGGSALAANAPGPSNTAIGYFALQSATGSYNVALGQFAGFNITNGTSNVMIANVGSTSDTGTIRIGDSNQTRTFIGGIRGVTTGNDDAIAVVIDSNGQLGTKSSSRRFKTDIEDMGDMSSDVMKLRPVTFHYKQRPEGRLEYGLIAEEVAQVYPDLVVNTRDGQVETVQYDKLTPMLLNEVQKQQQHAQQQDETIRRLEEQNQQMAAILNALESRLPAKQSKRVR